MAFFLLTPVKRALESPYSEQAAKCQAPRKRRLENEGEDKALPAVKKDGKIEEMAMRSPPLLKTKTIAKFVTFNV